jgi:hypothetical protein
MVVAGRAEPEPNWPSQLVDQVRMARQSALNIAARYRGSGFTVVIDDFLDPCLQHGDAVAVRPQPAAEPSAAAARSGGAVPFPT